MLSSQDEEAQSKAFIDALLLQETGSLDRHEYYQTEYAANTPDYSDQDQEYLQKKKTKKPKRDPPPKPNKDNDKPSGTYTAAEETLFLEGLELHGRDWAKLQAHVQTRDSASLRSHAQKHFIKLFRDDKALPRKVAESGGGYTLSGKPLDPASASARGYLGRAKEKITKICKESDLTPDDFITSPIPAPSLIIIPDSPGPEKAKIQEAPLKIRPKRAVRRKIPSTNFKELTDLHSPHTLIQLDAYSHTTQPYSLHIDPSKVLTLIDLHGHLMKTEVIGLLAGTWDNITKRLTIKKAFPCRSLTPCESINQHTNVELDPTSEVEVRNKVRELGLIIVGWYHSHPTFPPNPSIIDLNNQDAYQKLFETPFVGVIVGTYDVSLPTSVSAINWFHVDEAGTGRALLVNESVHNPNESFIDFNEMLELISTLQPSNFKYLFTELWRNEAGSIEQTRLEKVLLSLAYRVRGRGEEFWMWDGEERVVGVQGFLGRLERRLRVF